MPVVTISEWDRLITQVPEAHVLQTTSWGELKSAFGWRVVRVVHEECGAQILFRRLPFGFTIAYIPKGPVGPPAGWKELWVEVDLACRRKRSILLIVEPNLFVEELAGAFNVPPDGFSPAIQTIQPPRTIVIDITGEESEILARMKQKTRYNIRLAQKRGVVVAPSQDLVLFHRLMQETGKRDGFGVHSQEYYQKAYDLFHPLGKCELLLATYQGEPLAALMVFAQSNTAWYFYGASGDLYRELMSTYLLQFEAMLWARAKGCSKYDLWGVPDAELEALEDGFLQQKDGLWGVYRFKRGFGGELRRAVTPWQRIYQPLFYPIYRWWVKRRGLE